MEDTIKKSREIPCKALEKERYYEEQSKNNKYIKGDAVC